MKKYFYTTILVVVFSFIFQAYAVQQLEVNPGFAKKAVSEIATPKAPVTKLTEGREAQKPIWNVGYKWEYEWERPDMSCILTREIVREETFNGIPCFVMTVRGREVFITKDVLGRLATKRKGKVTRKRDAPIQPLAWPLKVGRQWANVFTFERPQEGATWDIDTRVVVTGFEEVVVPAGMFKAFKIEIYNSRGGNLRHEYWYSPKVKWFVKKITFSGRGSRQREERLKSYTIN